VTGSARVSIVIPLFNDEEYVAAALNSCLAQTLRDVEVICVDDASTDTTAEIVESYQRRDSRIRLIRQPANLSAFQARRAGIAAAEAPYILFLDGDDELVPHAAQTALAVAQKRNADVVGFGVTIVTENSPVPRRFEAALQPVFTELDRPAIIPSLFPAGEVANGHLWRYLFAAPLLRQAYANVPEDLRYYRANDLPVTFLALTHARRYASTADRLYRYHFRRGTSGHAIDGMERFQFLMSGIDPISAVRNAVVEAASHEGSPASTLASYESARLHIIGNVLHGWLSDTSGDLREKSLRLLQEKVGELTVVQAAAMFCEDALSAIAGLTDAPAHLGDVRSVLLMTAHLDTGGLQSVLIDQATRLHKLGYRVTVVVLRDTDRRIELPAGVDVIILGGTTGSRVGDIASICQEREIDVIIDHHILYNDRWPWFVLAGHAVGVPTIGWVHNFALRPIFDGTRRLSFLTEYARLLFRVVTLSPVDVAFWKLQGVPNAVYLANPPSSLMLSALEETVERRVASPLNLAWWGRLDGPTKQVDHLIRIAAQLKARGVDFRLRIIGPDSRNLTASQLQDAAVEAGVADRLELVGERHGSDLSAELADAHVFVSASAIEGFQLTILEAQAMGMPVVMYDLPWLTSVRSNGGVISTPPNDPTAFADALVSLAEDPDAYARYSSAGRDFARRAAGVDVDGQLVGLLTDSLPPSASPEPSITDAQLLMSWLIRYSERSIRILSRGGASDSGSQRALRRAQRELKHVMSGPSYRIGRIVTFLPRRVMRLLRSSTRATQKAS